MDNENQKIWVKRFELIDEIETEELVNEFLKNWEKRDE